MRLVGARSRTAGDRTRPNARPSLFASAQSAGLFMDPARVRSPKLRQGARRKSRTFKPLTAERLKRAFLALEQEASASAGVDDMKRFHLFGPVERLITRN